MSSGQALGRTGSTTRKSSFRESFKKVDKENGGGGEKSGAGRRQSIVQMELSKQKPKLAAKLYPTYTEMPQMWAEVSDTQQK